MAATRVRLRRRVGLSTARKPIALAIGLWALVWGTPGAGATSAPVFEYLYIEANDRDSSGGHAAICFAEQCYHYQHVDGLLRLHRDGAAHIDHLYRALGNRSVHAVQVPVSRPVYRQLRDAFARAYHEQAAEFAVADALADDVRVLEYLRARQRGDIPAVLRLPGTGFLFGDAPEAPLTRGSGPTLAPLTARIEAEYGHTVIERRRAALRADLTALRPETSGRPVARGWVGFGARYRDAVYGLLALAALRAGAPLRPDAAIALPAAVAALSVADRERMLERAAGLERSLIRLFGSSRPDWGDAMLAGLARLLALQRSAAEGTLVLLDGFEEDAAVIPSDAITHHRDALVPLLAERRQDFAHARDAFFASRATDEATLSDLELASTLLADLEGALSRGAPLRVPPRRRVPEKSARRDDWPVPPVPVADLEQGLAAARRRERTYRRELTRRYAYDLITNNCVTAIFATIDVATGDTSPVRGGTLDFIPFLSTRTMAAMSPDATEDDRPSLRHVRLARMAQHEAAVLVGARESIVFTARAYVSHEDDAVFVFFTDTAVWPRPVFGLVNLAAGLGAAVVGIATLPFDGGTLAQRGFEGALFSLPELAFVNLRKGSYPFAPRAWLAE